MGFNIMDVDIDVQQIQVPTLMIVSKNDAFVDFKKYKQIKNRFDQRFIKMIITEKLHHEIRENKIVVQGI